VKGRKSHPMRNGQATPLHCADYKESRVCVKAKATGPLHILQTGPCQHPNLPL